MRASGLGFATGTGATALGVGGRRTARAAGTKRTSSSGADGLSEARPFASAQLGQVGPLSQRPGEWLVQKYRTCDSWQASHSPRAAWVVPQLGQRKTTLTARPR